MMDRVAAVSATSSESAPLGQSVRRALAVLRCASSDTRGVTAREVSEALGLRRPTVYHLLNTLVAEGFLARSHDRRYRLGLAVGQLAEAFRRSLAPPEELVTQMRDLALRTGEPAYVTGWVDETIAVLARVPGQHPVGVGEFPLGMVGDAHARASGKLLLALAEPDVRDAYLAAHPPVALTRHTIVEAAALERELDEIRARGYALDVEEFTLGVCCLAVAFDKSPSYTISLAAPHARFVERFDEYLDAIFETGSGASVPGRPSQADAFTTD
jgi:IclR family transcriptional regulator, acetate operon repressor